jgi:type II secretory ATPase GspE/PulE/Tfp pilus assembly ATPase PilB-like protein
MSQLDIAEKRRPQDGRFRIHLKEGDLDFRVSILPTPYGEAAVLRILNSARLFSFEELNLSQGEKELLEDLIQQPHGIIFVTGPTGSGKTTTLYSCLSKINTVDKKIITLEDPIEYQLPAITQIQINPAIDLTFARGLRSILRHDPNVILVGEVRDVETAEIAIQVALTGHLIFSTLHTNDAAGGITRLLNMGIESYLITSTVECFIAQRLVRRICPTCKMPKKLNPKISKKSPLFEKFGNINSTLSRERSPDS